jgi:exopolysaccharide biosynthesis predicted pyruvyltransferase EpsI
MKIAFIGASGYGNIGDDTYPLVFRAHFSEHELIFYNSDLPESLPEDLNLLVLGGGGLIYGPSSRVAHFRYMQFYMDFARERGIPWGFIGCGLQLRRDGDGYDIGAIDCWIEYLRNAHFLTVRSAKCVEIIRELTGGDMAVFFPDLAYLLDPISSRRQPQHKRVTLVPCGSVHTNDESICQLIEPFLSVGYELTILRMGAACDDQIHLDRAAETHPQATLIVPDSPATALETIASSSFVITGRYHGMVFSRIAGIPFHVRMRASYKVLEENLHSSIQDAVGHINALKSVIDQMT